MHKTCIWNVNFFCLFGSNLVCTAVKVNEKGIETCKEYTTVYDNFFERITRNLKGDSRSEQSIVVNDDFLTVKGCV